MDLVTILPNLAIGVVAILALGYVTKEFIDHLKDIHTEHKMQLSSMYQEHSIELRERENTMRTVEREVRTTVLDQLAANTEVMNRVMTRLDSK